MTKTREQGEVEALIGDTPTNKKEILNPFHIHFEGGFRNWIAQEGISLALTTYEVGKLIIIGPGMQGGTIVTERDFERCMAMHVEEDRNIWISTQHSIWKLENGLEKDTYFEGWDRVYLPRTSYVTGGVDVHEININDDGDLYGIITGYNCIAKISAQEAGSFSPHWRPPFISEIIAEDRCHLNGMCLEDGKLAYASMVGNSNELNGWREQKQDGGIIMDIRTNEIIAENLSMPHTPRIHNGEIWFLEAGKGYLCRIDKKTGKIERKLWRPGFLRGLRFYKNYALICSSTPRDKTFKGLPLDQELEDRGEEARCALDIIDLDQNELIHSVSITGSVSDIYDVAILENCKQPLLHGIKGDDIRKIVVLGADET